MLVCPHCSQEIEVKALEKVSWWNTPIGGASASLGWGSVVIIAFFFLVFSNLSDDVSILSRQVDELTVLVKEIHRSISDTP